MLKDKLVDESEEEIKSISAEAILSGLQKQDDAIEFIKFLEKKLGGKFEFDSLRLSDEERRKRLGERIRMMRHGLGLKQIELAEKLGVSKGAIAAYEIGKNEPNLKNLIGLSRILGVPTDWLLGEAPLPK